MQRNYKNNFEKKNREESPYPIFRLFIYSKQDGMVLVEE